MSLDVYLHLNGGTTTAHGSGIFVRENGATVEISREEWDEKFPGREPIVVCRDAADDDGVVFSRNITHNVNTMADKAGIYNHLWRPDEIGITTAAELIEPLRSGLARLKAEPDSFRQFNPPNGWGSYEGLVAFVEAYLAACEENPTATVTVSR